MSHTTAAMIIHDNASPMKIVNTPDNGSPFAHRFSCKAWESSDGHAFDQACPKLRAGA